MDCLARLRKNYERICTLVRRIGKVSKKQDLIGWDSKGNFIIEYLNKSAHGEGSKEQR